MIRDQDGVLAGNQEIQIEDLSREGQRHCLQSSAQRETLNQKVIEVKSDQVAQIMDLIKQIEAQIDAQEKLD